MKKLILILISISLITSCHTQEDENKSNSSNPEIIANQVLTEATKFSNSDFTTTSNLNTNDGILNITSKGLTQLNWNTLHEDSELEFIYKENSKSKAYIGFKSQNPYGYLHSVFTLYENGKINIYNDKLELVSSSSENNNNYEIGDILKTSIKRIKLKYIFSIYNLTKAWKISYDVQCDPMGKPFVAHNESKPAIQLESGNISVISYKLTSFSYAIENYFAGDSITFGQSSSTEDKRWAALVNGHNLISGGGADVTQNVKNRLPEIIAIKPKRVFLMIGGNDILFKIPSNVWMNNLKEIRSQLVLNGIEVVHIYTTPRDGASKIIDFIKNEPTFKTDMKIDVNSILNDGNPDVLKPEYNWGDGIHVNNEAMTKIASKINSIYN
ncbi:GDSL-type esterase/lipase family protein [Elizabethkingia miricola]|uniref:SGNH/GDSL hydrolase family protein n=1 Tax=Elizabethkingia miricola TaxID=172045 RepID=UPI0020196A46|nr:GDSL-type esterase/lipase family protein [Elizabethkingia miricola]MCL1656769.1 GDSL-type esterase/lipase family protein [Elizabethkingia miricola]